MVSLKGKILILAGCLFIAQGLTSHQIIPYKVALFYFGVDPANPTLLLILPFYEMVKKFYHIFDAIAKIQKNKKKLTKSKKDMIEKIIIENNRYEQIKEIEAAYSSWGILFVSYTSIFALTVTTTLVTAPFTQIPPFSGQAYTTAFIQVFIGLNLIWVAQKKQIITRIGFKNTP